MLEIAGLNAWYGTSHVLQGVDLAVRRGEVVCLVGRNGAGKTTTLKSVMGLLRRVQGTVTFLGQDLLRRPAHARYRMGLAYVPEERRIVPGLSVRENLTLGLLASPHRREGRASSPAWPRPSRAWPSALAGRPRPCPAASSRCSPSRGRWPRRRSS